MKHLAIRVKANKQTLFLKNSKAKGESQHNNQRSVSVNTLQCAIINACWRKYLTAPNAIAKVTK